MKKYALVAVAFLLVLVVTYAQNQTGQIFGTVTDPTGATVANVKVTVTSPALLQPLTVTTGGVGSYQFPGVPIGTYSVQFDAAGYRPFLRENVRIDIGFNAEINAQLSLASVEQSVEVSAAAPVVDTQSTAQSTELDQQDLNELPVARSFFNAVELSGGAAESAKDVGGAQNLNQPSFVALGAASGQNRYFYDGADIAPSGASNAMWVDYNSVQEMQVQDGGADASVQTSGMSINMVVKSGSDAFHGTFHEFEEGQSFEANNLGPKGGALRAALNHVQPESSAGNPLTHFRDIGLDIGGPIKKGKLWVWGDWGDNGVWVGADKTYQQTSGCAPVAANPLNFDYGTVRSCTFNFPTFIRAYVFKVGWNVFHNNTLTFTNEYSNKEVLYNGLTPLVPLGATRPQNAACGDHFHWGGLGDAGKQHKPPFLWDCGWPSLWKWDDQEIINDHWVMDVAFFHFAKRNEFALQPASYGQAIQLENSSSAIQTSNTLVSEFQPMNNVKISSSYFLPGKLGGNQTFKFGYNWIRFENYMEDNAGDTAEAEEIFNSGTAAPFSVPLAVNFYRPGFYDAFNYMQNLYVTDTYSRGRWTFNMGVRWDHQTDREAGQNIPASPYEGQMMGTDAHYQALGVTPVPFTFLPAINYPGAQGGVAWNTFAPRFGATYNLFGRSKTVLKASFAQYFDQRTSGQFSDVFDTVESNTAQSFVQFNWDGSTANGLPLMSGVDPRTIRTFGNNYNSTNPGSTVSPNSVDPNIKDPKTNEVTAGVSQQVGPGFAISATYTYRRYTDFIYKRLNGITSANYVPCQTPTAANPSVSCPTTNPTTGVVTQNNYAYNSGFVCSTTASPLLPTQCPSVTFFIPNIPTPSAYTLANQPDYHVSYQGLQIVARKVMSKNWMFNGALTIQSTRQYWTASDAFQDPTNIAQQNGAELSPTSSPGGGFPISIAVNARWNARLGGLYRLPWGGINIAATDDLTQGYPYLSAISVSSRGNQAGSVAVLIAPPGSQRLGYSQNVALRIDKSFTIRERIKIDPSLDIYNIFNFNTILGQQPNQNSANANYIDYMLSPRLARIGVVVSF
jgi:hypothetical protein